MSRPTIVWFRDDLRLADNPALRQAVDADEPIVCLYVLDDDTPARPLGAAARWWLNHSLASLGASVRDRGGVFVLRRGRGEEVVAELADELDAGAVLWNRRYGGRERAADARLKEALRDAGRRADSFQANLLYEPWEVRTGAGDPYSVFTPFWRAARHLPAPRGPLPEPRELSRPRATPEGDNLGDWELLPTAPDWAGGLRERWEPGEAAARRRLRTFLSDDLGHYDAARDEPSAGATSELSPRLRWGELSPFQVLSEAADAGADAAGFLSELGWREFAYHTLFHFPALHEENWRPYFDAFPWPRLKPTHLEAWQQGRTGYRLVDAGMRELWQTGVMHNRIRMVAASFLTKNLLIDWRRGEEWFWDTLVDADPASNPFNWQWVAGSGADASPYFRIFNPETQADKFDRDGLYVAQWAPEYTAKDDDADASPPEPIVDLKATRQRALDAYDVVKDARR